MTQAQLDALFPGKPVVPAGTLGIQEPTSEIFKNVTADRKPIPIVYGRAQIGGRVFALHYDDDSGVMTVGYLFCLGEIDSYNSIYYDGGSRPNGVTVNKYYGTQGQGIDPLLQAAIPGGGYQDTLPGVAYIVIQYPAGTFEGWPRIVANVRGKKVYNYKDAVTEYSQNPAYHLADLLTSTEYGLGWQIDSASVINVADACDGLIPNTSDERRKSHTIISQARPVQQWAEVISAYASCWIVQRGDTAVLIPDRPRASGGNFNETNIIEGTFKIKKKDSSELPTVMRVTYTDTSTGSEWRERESNPATIPGATEVRESVVNMSGFKQHAMAYREAVERLNKLWLSDLEVSFETTGFGYIYEIGDVVNVTHPYGLDLKAMRVIDVKMAAPAQWRLTCVEYDAAAYSDEVVTEPSNPDTNLPKNAPPPPVENLTIGESTYQLQNGLYSSRLELSWDASASIYTTGYNVQVFDGSTLVWQTNTSSTSMATSPLKELVDYTVEVRAISALYVGEPATGTYSIIGKFAIPDAPAYVNGFEAGGEVRLWWPKSTDVDAQRYEVRYGLVTDTWDDAQQLDIVDGLRLTTRDVPPGSWRFFVKTIDSVFQYSDGAATTDVTVTQDDNAFTAGTLDPINFNFFGAVGLSGSVENRLNPPVFRVYSNAGETWADLFGSVAMDTITDSLAAQQTFTVASQVFGTELDLLEDKSGNWLADINFELLGGSGLTELGLAVDGGNYVFGNMSQQGIARKAIVKVSGAGAWYVDFPSGFIRADVIAQEEVGTGTSIATPATPTVVSLSKQYSAARSIVITPEGNQAYTAVYDNIQLNNGGVTTFDVYIFNSSGVQVAVPFRWQWKGV